jgi:carbon-monoxide dehydrogenase large subunit
MVEVDIETGRVMIEKFLVAEDAGRLINPMIVDGQIHGGVAQGIANALLEEIVYDETGNILTATLADYLPPTAREIPPIEIHHLETLTEAFDHQGQGAGRGRCNRAASRRRQCHQRRPVAVSASRSMSFRQRHSASARAACGVRAGQA